MNKHINDFNRWQIQSISDNNESYDILLFVQIPAEHLHPMLLSYMRANASYWGTGSSREFMYMTADLELYAIHQFEKWPDCTIVDQCRKLANDLSAVQYIHVIY